jgi:hypothetical protein
VGGGLIVYISAQKTIAGRIDRIARGVGVLGRLRPVAVRVICIALREYYI